VSTEILAGAGADDPGGAGLPAQADPLAGTSLVGTTLAGADLPAAAGFVVRAELSVGTDLLDGVESVAEPDARFLVEADVLGGVELLADGGSAGSADLLSNADLLSETGADAELAAALAELEPSADQFPLPLRPLPPGGPRQVAARVRERLGEVLPEKGVGPSALENLEQLLRAESVQSRHPHTIAHLHCSSLPVAVAADRLVAELNPSMDSWDQSAAACVIEDELIYTIARLVYPRSKTDPSVPPGGTVTSGGTEGNLLALLFARDEAIRRHFDTDPAHEGLPGYAAGKVVVLCSAAAHFSIARAAALLGLGEQAVHAVPVTADHSLDPAQLARLARRLHSEGRRIAMVVATAGTTDAGAVDPLRSCAEVARQHGAWFHVDAAYAGPLLFSAEHAGRLAGIELADSVSLDLHKFGWQPIPAGLLVTRTRDAFALAGRRVAYLSDLDDELAGYPNLLGRSLHTTRRADAVKMVATLQTLGRYGLAERIERCFELTAYAADVLARHERFELAMAPALTTVLFRYLPQDGGDSDQINAGLRRRLLVDGSAVIGRTRLPEISPAEADVFEPVFGPDFGATPGPGLGPGLGAGSRSGSGPRASLRTAHARSAGAAQHASSRPGAPAGFGEPGRSGSLRLKLTLLNPETRPADLDRLIDLIAAAGAAEESCQDAGRPGFSNPAGAARRDRKEPT
jgi:L-2,4-diaminobutyrate decarboxylase